MKSIGTKNSRVNALLTTMMLLFNSAAFAIGPEYSGSWFNPDQSGHGFSIEYSVMDDGAPLIVAYWYVYDSEGNPIFLIGTGEPKQDNTVTLTFEAPYGMKFGEFDPGQTVREGGGIGVFTFQSSKVGTFEYEPSGWMEQTYGVSPISIPVVQLIGVALEDSIATDSYVDTYIGPWVGRMLVDSSSVGSCHNADVHLQVEDYPAYDDGWRHASITVIRDGGGQATYNWGYNDAIFRGSFVADEFTVFGDPIDMNIQFPSLQTTGHAKGFWNYRSGACYGEWFFTK